MLTRSPMRRNHRRTGPKPHTVALVLQRDGYACIRCGAAELQLHHRRPRAMGGTDREETNQPQNLVSLCLRCHTHVERHRSDAITAGWLVQQLDDPATVACLVDHESRYVYLGHDGAYHDSPPVGAA